MADEGLFCTPNSSRYLAAPAIASGGSYTFAVPSPFSSVATPATTWLAGWVGAPPHVLPDAPWMPICIGPAAPKPFWPLRTPGRVVWPLLLHRADAGQDRPRHAVLLPDLLVPG